METILLLLISSLFLQYAYRLTTYVVVDDGGDQAFSRALLIKFSGIIQGTRKPEFFKLKRENLV